MIGEHVDYNGGVYYLALSIKKYDLNFTKLKE